MVEIWLSVFKFTEVDLPPLSVMAFYNELKLL
jgi:hypothetical protein